LTETKIIKSLIESYFKIVRKNIKDTVPKSIMHLFINYCKKEIQNEMLKTLHQANLLGTLLKESNDISTKRASNHKKKITSYGTSIGYCKSS